MPTTTSHRAGKQLSARRRRAAFTWSRRRRSDGSSQVDGFHVVTASTVLRLVLWGWNVLEHEELDAREVRVAKTAERSPVFVSSCCDSLPAMPGAQQLDSDSGSGSWEQHRNQGASLPLMDTG
ncbi:unnamed protein product [Arctogadus glacialis]